MQIVINLMIKLIVYFYDEMNATIPYFLQVFVDTLKNIIIKIYKKEYSDIPLYLLLILSNLYLIFFLLVYIEIIILKVFGLEMKTKKYLKISIDIDLYELTNNDQSLVK